MRTTIDIDDELMASLLSRNPGSSKKEAVEAAIRDYLGSEAYRIAKSLVGKIEFDDDFMRDFRKFGRPM